MAWNLQNKSALFFFFLNQQVNNLTSVYIYITLSSSSQYGHVIYNILGDSNTTCSIVALTTVSIKQTITFQDICLPNTFFFPLIAYYLHRIPSIYFLFIYLFFLYFSFPVVIIIFPTFSVGIFFCKF